LLTDSYCRGNPAPYKNHKAAAIVNDVFSFLHPSDAGEREQSPLGEESNSGAKRPKAFLMSQLPDFEGF
jgi:hypothetical protein